MVSCLVWYHECHIHSSQMHTEHLRKHKPLYFAFVDLKKAFDRVPIELYKGIKNWKIRFAQAIYTDAASSIHL